MRRSASRCSRRRFLRGSLGLVGLGLLTGCGLLPPEPRQTARVRRIGYLAQDSPPSQPGSAHEAFQRGLQELGYVEGDSIIIEWRFADRKPERLPELATELIGLGAELIVTVGTEVTQVARQASSTLPLVSPTLGDPIAAGLVASLARPGGNVTGLSLLLPQSSGKRLELLREIVPGTSRVAVLWRPGNPSSRVEFEATQDAARKIGIQVQSLEVHETAKLGDLVEAARVGRADGLMIPADPLLFAHEAAIADLAARSRLPSVHVRRESAIAGGLIAYGPNFPAQFRRAATYVHKILNGASPADLPIEQPTTFDFVINLKTARALGLTIPRSVLQQATEVIQ